jgi:hypothetical protein
MTLLAVGALWLLVVLVVLSLCVAAGGRRGPSGVR